MITFKKVRFKNFLSFGNTFTEIDLNTHHNTCIIGINGSGKSSFMDAITYSLFNKAYRPVNKPQLINSVNEKECLVEIEFTIGTTDWKVRRGQKPAIFEIYKNDELLDQSSSVIDQQRWFEQNVLKMNYKSFTQVVILGNSNFIPFMQLTPASRREVIEDLLDIKIFSSMNVVVKDKIKSIKDDIKLLEIKKDSLFDKVKMQSNFIEEIEKEGKSQIEDRKKKIVRLAELSVEADQENSELLDITEKLNSDLEVLSDSPSKLKKLGSLDGKISQKISTAKNDKNFFTENSVCPTCTQTITEEQFKNGFTKKIRIKKRIKFRVGGEDHHMGVISVNTTSVVINVPRSSESFNSDATTYGYQNLKGSGSTISSARDTSEPEIDGAGGTSSIGFSHFLIYAKSGNSGIN